MLEEFIYQFLAVSVMSATWNGPRTQKSTKPLAEDFTGPVVQQGHVWKKISSDDKMIVKVSNFAKLEHSLM
jgi:hypothetical protein